MEFKIETSANYVQAIFAWERSVQHGQKNQKGTGSTEDATTFYAEISMIT
jgi:hypothetical protein